MEWKRETWSKNICHRPFLESPVLNGHGSRVYFCGKSMCCAGADYHWSPCGTVAYKSMSNFRGGTWTHDRLYQDHPSVTALSFATPVQFYSVEVPSPLGVSDQQYPT